MRDKERRHQEEDRKQFYTDEQKARIQRKSDDRCVYCGKKVFLGYEGTIDHYIPLKKGGTNDEVNLVLMCHDCNQNKGSRILPLNIAASYLNEGPSEELGEYFDEYVKKYDYVSRGNLISSDAYELFFLPSALEDAENRAKKRGKKMNLNIKRSKYILKRAYPDDEDKVVAYYTKYLKKYNILASEEAARVNIQFWMRFGSIYYIEKNNEIAVISCVTVNRNGYISFDIFAYYSTMLAWTMVRGIIDALTGSMMVENDLPYLPISYNMLSQDELARYRIGKEVKAVRDGVMICKLCFIENEEFPQGKDQEEHDKFWAIGILKFKEFIMRFYDIEDDIMLYLYENDLMEYTWMADEILGRRYFDEEYYQEF